MNGSYKFYFLYTCGCVISERALKSMQSDETMKCLKCDKVYDRKLDLIVLNGSDDDVKVNQEKFNLRKEKQLTKKKVTTDPTTTTTAVAAAMSKSKRSIESDDVKKVDAKKPKSIQEDPNASDVFKSLFNTSEKAKNQTRGHWVTFNPQYF